MKPHTPYFIAITAGCSPTRRGARHPAGGFGIQWTVSTVFIVIIGGIGTIEGPIFGAILYVLLSEYLDKYPGYSMIILGVIAIVMIVALPYGILGTLERKLHFQVFSTKRVLKD